MLLNLVEEMESTIQYVADVEQFAKLAKLVEAIEEVKILVKKTEEFVVYYCSRNELGALVTLSLPSMEYNVHAVKTLRSVVSTVDSDELADLKSSFERFKQKFDRGIVIQSAMTSEQSATILKSLVDVMGTVYPTLPILWSILTIYAQKEIRFLRDWSQRT